MVGSQSLGVGWNPIIKKFMVSVVVTQKLNILIMYIEIKAKFEINLENLYNSLQVYTFRTSRV